MSKPANPMRILFFLLAALFSLSASAQLYNPVKWDVSLKPDGKGQYLFVAKATIDNGWWVYSQHLESDEGPIATTVNFDPGSHFELVGKNKESDNAKKAFDKFFEMNVTKFVSYYTIEQKIKVTDASKPITGYINFMTCNDDRCLPPTDHEFELTAPASGDSGADNAQTKSTASADPKKEEAPAEKKRIANLPTSL